MTTPSKNQFAAVTRVKSRLSFDIMNYMESDVIFLLVFSKNLFLLLLLTLWSGVNQVLLFFSRLDTPVKAQTLIENK